MPASSLAYNAPMGKLLENNVFKTALLFEGGSMRASYSCAVAAFLLEKGVFFDNVYGVSAGSSNAVNYVSRDADRVIRSFTDFIQLPEIGDWKTFVHGEGLLNAHWIYQESGLPDAPLPFDFDTFKANPAHTTLVAFERDTGRDRYFRDWEMVSLDDLMIRVRASSTLPIVMPPPCIDGLYYYDGGFAMGGGLPLDLIREDGFQKLLVVRTRPRGYRRGKGYGWARLMLNHRPYLRDALLRRDLGYNESCERLERMERDGDAYVFYCDDITISGMERDFHDLGHNFELGYSQVKREWPRIFDFLERSER